MLNQYAINASPGLKKKTEWPYLYHKALNVTIVHLRKGISAFNWLIQHVESIRIHCAYASESTGGRQVSGREFTIIKQLSHINGSGRHRQCNVCAISYSTQAHCGNSSSIFRSLATESSETEKSLGQPS